MPRKKVSTTVYLEPWHVDQLAELHRVTGRPVATYVREGVEAVLRLYGHLTETDPDDVPLIESVVEPKMVRHVDPEYSRYLALSARGHVRAIAPGANGSATYFCATVTGRAELERSRKTKGT